jgi:hypothetical protein
MAVFYALTETLLRAVLSNRSLKEPHHFDGAGTAVGAGTGAALKVFLEAGAASRNGCTDYEYK